MSSAKIESNIKKPNFFDNAEVMSNCDASEDDDTDVIADMIKIEPNDESFQIDSKIKYETNSDIDSDNDSDQSTHETFCSDNALKHDVKVEHESSEEYSEHEMDDMIEIEQEDIKNIINSNVSKPQQVITTTAGVKRSQPSVEIPAVRNRQIGRLPSRESAYHNQLSEMDDNSDMSDSDDEEILLLLWLYLRKKRFRRH